MIKRLTFQEVAKKLAEEGVFVGYVRGCKTRQWATSIITGIDLNPEIVHKFIAKTGRFASCAIEIPDEYEPYPDDVCPPLKCGDVIVSKDKKRNVLLTCLDKPGRCGAFVACGSVWLKNTELFEEYTMFDGSPIGRIKT